MPFVNSTVFIFCFNAHLSDWLVMKVKVKQWLQWVISKFYASEQTFPKSNFLSQIFFLVNLFTPAYCSLRCIQSHMYVQAHTEEVYMRNLSHTRNHNTFTFVLFLWEISRKEKFSIEGFFIEHYMYMKFTT